MSVRRQLPVSSPLAFPTLAAALWPTITRGAGGLLDAAAALRETYETPRVALTDSGTSALVMALRLTVGKGGTVAFPGYACVDLAAAARFARVRVRLYDIDPRTLSPDLDSLAARVRRGANAIALAPLYGFPADMNGVDEIASRFGIPVIEDAAQAAGGTLHGRPLGGFGALSVLSFGRGKGTTGGRGGALLGYDVAFDDAFAREMTALGAPARGWSDLAAAGAQWVMGRPGLYGIPSAIPALRLGEMVYHPAHAPRSLSAAAAALVTRALRAAPAEVAIRRRNAAALAIAADEGGDVQAIDVIPDGVSGMLRFPVRDTGSRLERPDLGILRGYPRTLHEQPELRHCLEADEPPTPGAAELRRTLFTLPTHGFVTRRDMEAMIEWLRVPMTVLAPVLAEAGATGGLAPAGRHRSRRP